MKETEIINFNDYFYYDETSPSYVRWAVDRPRGRNAEMCNVNKDDIAGTIKNSTGRWKVGLKGKLYYVSRIVWAMYNGSIPNTMIVDHIDRDKTNNNINNLRLVTRKGNARNCTKKSNNSTGVTGVSRGGSFWDDPIYHYDKYYEYYSATWVDFDGKKHAKYFSVEKLGEEEAFKLACEFRSSVIEKMNQEGAGYTINHGKDKENNH